MESVLLVVVGVLLLVVLGLLIWSIAGRSAGTTLLAQQLEALKAAQDNIRETLNKSLQTGQDSISRSLQSSQKVLGQLNTQVGELQGTNKQMLQMQTDVKRLQDILSSPKLRGQMGEWSLENLLSQVLPTASYELQYTFKDGKVVDALVRMTDFAVPVDAKFPLPAFETLSKAKTSQPTSTKSLPTISGLSKAHWILH